MTAIITKQNAKDKAFINSGGGGYDYPLDATFDTIKVNKEATFTVNNQEGPDGVPGVRLITFANHEQRITNDENTIADHETRIATLEQSGGGGGDYPKDATFDNITVNQNANFKIGDKTVSFANHETRIATLEQSGGGGGGDSLFTSYTGYDYFAVKNENITTASDTFWDKSYYYLSIDFPSSIVTSLQKQNASIQVFNIIIRDRIFYTTNAECITQFNITYDNNTFKCPVITFLDTEDNHNVCSFEYKDSPFENNNPAIFIHDDLHISPHSLYINGDMSIVYLLNQSGIQSIAKEIKCDIIDARNCFKLHESDVPYLYKPKYFKELKTLEGAERLPGGTANNILEAVGDYWTCIWTFDNNQKFIDGQTFTFEEYCFGNTFSFTWSESTQSWNGNNVRMLKATNQVSCKGSEPNWANFYIKHDDDNYKIIKLIAANIGEGDNYMQKLQLSPCFKQYCVYDDGTTKTTAEANIQRAYESFESKNGYDRWTFEWHWIDKKKFNQEPHFTYIVTEIMLNDVKTILKRRFDHAIEGYPVCYDETNTIESLSGLYVNKISNQSGSGKNIELHLIKAFTKARDEINWDGVTNPFIYIIDQQFYKVTPNPVGSTTLYTDYNITSSKVITADNITTMRSDLNLVTNTVDVVSWDVDKLRSDFETFEEKVESELHKTSAMDYVDGVLTVVDGIFAIGSVIKFFKSGGIKNIMSLFGRDVEAAVDTAYEMDEVIHCIDSVTDDTRIIHDGVPLLARANTVYGRSPQVSRNEPFDWDKALQQLSQIITWGNSEASYIPFDDEKYSKDTTHPSNCMLTLSTAFEVAHQQRDTLKPAMLVMSNSIIENHNNINTYNDYMVSKYDFINIVNEVPEVVCTKGNQRLWIRFKNYVDEGDMSFRVVWDDVLSDSNWDDCKIAFRSIIEFGTHKIIGYEITEWSVEQDGELSRFQTPVMEFCNYDWDDSVCQIVIDAVPNTSDPAHIGMDTFREITNVTSNVKTHKDETVFDKIVYKDDLKQILESNNASNADIERRLSILEAKCKNIIIDNGVSVQSNEQTLTIEERLTLLEAKCANMKI